MAQEPTAPFAAFQYGTNGCLEVGARDTQPKPYAVPSGYDITAGYPAFGYDPSGFTRVGGTNACRYNFYDKNPRTDPSAVVITSGYCVQYAAGQLSGTGYDPQAHNSTRNLGYVQRILQNYWPATDLPAVPAKATDTANTNRQRSGAVAMAIHYFTDGIVMPPDYQTPALYDVVMKIVDDVLTAGAAPAPADPTPAITGPVGGPPGALLGPYTLGANAVGDLAATVSDAEAFTDAAGTHPFVSGTTLPPGTQLWIRPSGASAGIAVSGPVPAGIGTFMVGDPTQRVQSMMLAQQRVLLGKSERTVLVTPDEPRLTSRASVPTGSAELIAGDSVTDVLTVVGLHAPAQLTTTLYGPVPPPPGGCRDIDWDTANAAVEHVYVRTVSADSELSTPSSSLDRPGCYTYASVLHPALGPDATIPPGDPDESLRVVPKPLPPPLLVITQASTDRTSSGGQVSDRITVLGLPDRAAMTVTTTLHGPLPPNDAGTCTGLDWTAPTLPTAAVLPPETVTGGQTLRTPPVTVTSTGCYSFQTTTTSQLLTGAEVPVGHGLGQPDETFQVIAAPTPAPVVNPTPPAFPTPPDAPKPPDAPAPPRLPATGIPALPAGPAAALTVLGLGLIIAARATARGTTCTSHAPPLSPRPPASRS
ncbi:hypothetical protein GCM10009839_17870 [Catenulispora yoronensis]|uniref:Thioester domain-containing protein n=1 Tax=Catenulispora yoronensis TaxID=450799 RepID=A0ABN2TU04_9ACTN